jgi:CheY-like chemotaxis protein
MPRSQPFASDLPSHQTSILVVEDTDAERRLLVRLFEEEGYRVSEANDGIEALAYLFTTDTPHVVVLDWRMPHMDGLQFLEMVSQVPVFATHHRYLLLTAQYEALGHRLDDFTPNVQVWAMRKPFEVQPLLWRVAEAAATLSMHPLDEATEATDREVRMEGRH